MYSFKGDNPTKMYLDAINTLIKDGDECSPRGKLIKELRPASVEFDNPFNRVTFLGSRRVNPFFQIAESLWIISGRADVEWLTKFNANMSQFSDDGVWFNAPYGERIRSWNKNAAHGIIINPIDQLYDAYLKLCNDKDTRQAVVVISNPMFDNAKYTIEEKGKDIACNLIFTFKIRHNKLYMTVFNRSNDAHWGLWGANLCQFSTIQEVMLSWLKNSKLEEFSDLQVGTYTQVTDSLHIYLDDYGAKCTTDIMDYYKKNPESDVLADFTCEYEPRMNMGYKDFDTFLSIYWNAIDPYLMDDEFIMDSSKVKDLYELVEDMHNNGVIDDYWFFGIIAMLVYRLVKIDKILLAMKYLADMDDCQWKVSMLFFLKSFIYKVGKDESRMQEYNEICEIYDSCVSNIVVNLVNYSNCELLHKYLDL